VKNGFSPLFVGNDAPKAVPEFPLIRGQIKALPPQNVHG
jgi:hypothetical protein